MFTGIIEELGVVKSLQQEASGGWIMVIEAKEVLKDVHLGDSIAVNGTCLTVTHFIRGSEFTVGLAPETLRRTSLGEVEFGSRVNLERSLAAGGRYGGHFVQGHVDGTGIIECFRPEGDSLWVTIKAGPEIMKYIVPKGYIAIDGTSLTVCDVYPDSFTFMLVAYTQQNIVLPSKRVGNKVNIEVDIIGKYIEKFALPHLSKL
mmetsp:Transcript_26169/g.42892  ORF Transcript_26169/g.42892 Transcript_26169/m.42892 type:complete len:203 (+) Transcript_26169:193-801(+)|eukprot:CAMPEP_0184656546 /NCGR_PEP_ID=MMETSP0308-20130426/16583_1 /TAXON_ID=38269 /ORGANISM="Gloeochaete witrockiana, Strain SAG 46.84" /LENGTH=202 /DNA_ID=CAMNT_0027093719 /DNA_START=193 /DNA_END=801 /DNA_ORIENTATION=+